MAALVLPTALLGGLQTAHAQCREDQDLKVLATSVVETLACSRRRLAVPTAACDPTPAPACAGRLVDDLVSLATPPDLVFATADRQPLSPQIRCQRSLVNSIARYARQRVRSARSGQPADRADVRAARLLHAVQARCAVPVALTASGARAPDVGSPCAPVVPAAGDLVSSGELASCLEVGLRARLEIVLRPTIKPNIVVVLTDDQPAWMMDPLETVRTQIEAGGVKFVEASAQTPLCAPSRASVLTGQYAYHHRVLRNLSPDDATALDDSSTVATWLQGAGYRTGFFGKYVNGYERLAPYVPPGWTAWQAFVLSDYVNYTLVDESGGTTHFGTNASDYSTDVLAAKAADFVRGSNGSPFFLLFAPFGPHGPSTPAPRHVGRYAGVPPWRPASYDEADVSDKPAWVRDLPPLAPSDQLELDMLHESMLESLLSIDDGVSTILQALRDTGQAENTFVVFTSDNGIELGEHRWTNKGDPYEGSQRVPLVIRYPRLGPLDPVSASLVSNVDLAPTFAELAGVAPGLATDGTSLLGLLDGTRADSWRQDMLLEGWPLVPTRHMVVRSGRWKYVEYLGGYLKPGEVELYDLEQDPDELTSVHQDPANAAIRASLAVRLRELNPAWTQPIP